MSKVYFYMVFCTGLIMLLSMAGIPVGAEGLLDFTESSTSDVSSFSLSSFFTEIAALFGIGVATGIAISFFTKTPNESYIIAPLALGIFTAVVGTLIGLINYTKDMGFVYGVVLLLMFPITVGFAIAIINFWRGVDS